KSQAFRLRTLPTHRTLALGRVLLDPLQNAVLMTLLVRVLDSARRAYHVEVVTTLSRYCLKSQQLPISSTGQRYLQRLQSSPGYLQAGCVTSKSNWQIPTISSSCICHLQVALTFHFLILILTPSR